jgi:hypothetical protein
MSYILYWGERVIVAKRQLSNFQLYHGETKIHFDETMMRSANVLDNTLSMDLYSASSLIQQSASGHVTPLGHIILISSQPVFTLMCFAGKKQIYQVWFEPTINRKQCERVNHYTTDLVLFNLFFTSLKYWALIQFNLFCQNI